MKRALLIRFSSLGDVILVSSVFKALKENGFEAELLTFKPFGELFKGHPYLKRVIEVEKEELKKVSQIKRLARELSDYDLLFDLHGVLRSRLFTLFSPVKSYLYPKKSFLRRAMTVFKPLKAKWLFVPELYAQALRKAGLEVKNPRPFIPIKEEEKERVRVLYGTRLAVIAPGAKWPAKRYPIEKFKEVAKKLIDKGFTVLAVGGKEEKTLGEALQEVGVFNLCGQLSLRESLAAVGSSQVVISNDSAVVHMARAVKTPVVAIFGPTHPALGFAPYPDEGVALSRNLPCSPCSLHGKTGCRNRKCLEIEPEKVVSAALTLVESFRRGGTSET